MAEIGSLTIASNPYRVSQWPKASIKPAIQWVQDSAGYWSGSDRGAAQDIYETDVVFLDKESTINALDTALDASREGITLSGFTDSIFAPNVDHTGSISATVLNIKRKQVKWGYPSASSQLYALEVTFRAISPTLLGTSPSLSSLKLQDGFEAGDSYESLKAFSLNQSVSYADHQSDIGAFKGPFLQTTAQTKAILAYLLTTARANTVAFPSIGVTYPFGQPRGALPLNCKMKSFSLSRQDQVFWNLNLEMVENA